LRALTPPPTDGRTGRGAARASRAAGHSRPSAPPPVEYSEAVSRFLAQAGLTPASRRVYLISLTGWSWALVGRPTPRGAERRRAVPPLVALAQLDDPRTGPRLAAALTRRAAVADARTVNRELSTLRSATGWWADQAWISTDPTHGLRNLAGDAPALPSLTEDQAEALNRVSPGLREHAFWRLLRQTPAAAEEVLALDIEDLDLPRDRARRPATRGMPRPGGADGWICWDEQTTRLLRWLLAGRTGGPVFVTGRRAPAGTGRAHICPVTRRARLSYRRAAEILTAASKPLDPAGQGWTLRQLRRSDRAAAPAGGRGGGGAR
jgi:integrase/recombinase XerD